MERKTFRYFVSVDWEKGKQGFFSGINNEKFAFSCPPEFGGPEGFMSPEEIFVASIATCVMATFINVCSRNKIGIASYNSKAEGVMDYIEGSYRITKIFLRPQIIIKDPEQREECKRILEDAHQTCPVGKSVVSQVILEPELSVSEV